MSSVWLTQAKENRAYAEKRKAAKDAGLPPPPAPGQAKGKATGFAMPKSTSGATSSSGARFGNNSGFQAPSAVPVALKDFSWASDVQYLPKTGKLGIIPIRSPTNGPMCTRLTGGGTIPFAIGLQVRDAYGKESTNLTFTMDDAEERKAMERIHRDVTAYVMNIVTSLYPGITDFNYATLVGKVLSDVKSKKDGDLWPQLASVKIDPETLFSEDTRKEPLLQIINESSSAKVLNLPDVLGQRWTSMTIEWRFLVAGMMKEKDAEGKETGVEVPLVSISRRLRGHMYLKVDENQYHLVLPEDRALHDASECKRKHTKVEQISTFRLLEHARISEVKQKDQTNAARMQHMDGGDVVVCLSGGGSIPPFFLDTNREGNLVLSFCVESKSDEDGLDTLSKDLATLALSRRDEYFKKSVHSDDTLRACCKMVLPKKTEEAEAAGYARSLSLIFDHEKLNTTCSIIDGLGQRISNPNDIKGKKWRTLWFSLRCIFVKKVAGSLFEVGFSRRFIHVELQPDMESFVLNDAQESMPPSLEPDTKRSRAN